jgi:hypothetical protein
VVAFQNGVQREYSILNYLGYDFGGEQSLIEHYDYLKLNKNEDHIRVRCTLNHYFCGFL